MTQLDPQAQFPIVRQLFDPYDNSTYYVRAVVRNSATGTTLATIDLTDQGSGRFTYNYQTPADYPGTGTYIDIETTVYTDSGYTTKSPNHSVSNDQYVVQQRWHHALGGGGGSDINYKKIAKMIAAAAENIKDAMPEPITPRDVVPELLASERRLAEKVENAVSSIVIPTPEKPDLDKVVELIKADTAEVANLIIDTIYSIPEPDPVDLNPVLEAIANLPADQMNSSSKELSDAVSKLNEWLGAQKEMNNMKKAMQSFLSAVEPEALSVPEKPSKFDVNRERSKRLAGIV